MTYVQVYAATPTTITYGYTAGYMMGYVSAGVLVYGTGFYYPPVIVPGPVPIYYPYPYTYAGSVWYNPSNEATQQPRFGGSRLDSSSYQQLEHDRLGRQAGQRRFGGGRFRQ